MCDKVRIGDNTTAFDDNEFMNNTTNDLTTLADTLKSIVSYLVSLQSLLTML